MFLFIFTDIEKACPYILKDNTVLRSYGVDAEGQLVCSYADTTDKK